MWSTQAPVLSVKINPLGFAINYFPSTAADVLQCVSLLFFVCTLSSQRSTGAQKKKLNSFQHDHGPYYVNLFLFFYFPLFSYARAGTLKLYQMVNLIIETKEPNGSPSSLHASGGEKRNHLWELI